jgi:pyruvate/2-oxoglutarate dehydrogenase complex dihydrolipoamide acyltransferase (E2) component
MRANAASSDRLRRVAAAVLSAGVAVALPAHARAEKPAAAASARPRASSDPGTAALRHRVAQLRAERDAAAGRGFYLKLDAGQRRLALMLQGVALDDYSAEGLEWGVPQVLFVDRRPPAGWDASSFSKGRLDPARERDRIELVAPAPAPSPSAAAPGAPEPAASAPAVPKSAEESYSVPSPYRIVFGEGVSLEVRSKGTGARNRSVFQRVADAARLRLADLATALGTGPGRERVRLRVTLAADDAASLYRSLPPDVGLVVVGLPER